MIAWIDSHMALALGIALVVLGLLWLMLAKRKPAPQSRDYHDVLSEGAGPAQRNTALIDAAPAAAIAPLPVAEPVAEPVAAESHVAAAEGSASPASEPAPGDDLTRIKGVGPKLSALLRSLGVTTFAQIAEWGEADLAALDGKLGAFAGRPVRDNWVEQARLLAAGDKAGYEAQFGKL